MYLVDSREDFADAVRQAENGQMFGILTGEAFFRELLDEDAARERMECLAGLIDYKNLYYDDDECAVWYEDPQVAEVTCVEAEGVAACAQALYDAVCGLPRGMIVLATDESTYAMLEQDEIDALIRKTEGKADPGAGFRAGSGCGKAQGRAAVPRAAQAPADGAL